MVVDLPAPVITLPPVPEPMPEPPLPVPPTPEPLPAPVLDLPPLLLLDDSKVTTTLADRTLTVELAPDVAGVWLRLTLPDGRQSGVTDHGACRCIGLGGNGPHRLAVLNMPGLTVLTGLTLSGPWTVAATTQ